MSASVVTRMAVTHHPQHHLADDHEHRADPPSARPAPHHRPHLIPAPQLEPPPPSRGHAPSARADPRTCGRTSPDTGSSPACAMPVRTDGSRREPTRGPQPR
jgi:hypothetical protein